MGTFYLEKELSDLNQNAQTIEQCCVTEWGTVSILWNLNTKCWISLGMERAEYVGFMFLVDNFWHLC